MRRFFNRAEKAALYMAADGKCEKCSDQLEAGWHGDHVTPFALNGATDVVNGQALCPTCNLKKGKKTVKKELRVWQRQALDK